MYRQIYIPGASIIVILLVNQFIVRVEHPGEFYDGDKDQDNI